MKKVLDLLEQHVQWLALALGALFLGFMIWTYILNTPVLVTGVAPTPLTPGQVDEFIANGPASELDKAMKNSAVPEMPVPRFVDGFKEEMAFAKVPSEAWAVLPGGQVEKMALGPIVKATPLAPAVPIVKLPTVPMPEITGVSTGRSNVQMPVPAGAAAPAAGVQPVAGGVDKTWVSVGFKISAQALAESFRSVHVPAWSPNTTMLEVQLFRQEEITAGTWSEPTRVPYLEGQVTMDFPPAGNRQAEDSYFTWAQGHVADILQPAFLTWVKGDKWVVPGQPVLAAAPVQLPPLDPTHDYTLKELAPYSADEKKAWRQKHYEWEQSQKPKPQPRAPRSTPGRGNGGPPGGGGFPGGPGARGNQSTGMEVLAQVSPAGSPGRPFVPPGGPVPDMPDMPPQPNPVDNSTPAGSFPIPQGIFDPGQLTSDIVGWAHDDSVVPGHKYRYMVVYRIKNPIYNTNAAKNPALNSQFDLVSPKDNSDKAWSQPVNIANDTMFFVTANSGPNTHKARMKVFKWQNGVERAQVFEPSPGDVIGGKDGDVDYSTGWTVVDLRDDPRSPGSTIVIVMGPTGSLERRDYKTDQAKKELDQLNSQVSTTGSSDQLAGGAK